MQAPTVSQLLACDVQNDGHLRRYLFDDDSVRYVKIMSSPHNHHFHDQPLPCIPAGTWNSATIDIDRKTDQLIFQTAVTRTLGSVTVTEFNLTWCPPSIDHLDLQLYQGRSRNGRFATYRDSPFDLFGCPIVVKIARFDHEIPDIQQECDMYRLIHGKRIGSKFLGYVTEAGRIIGFVLKKNKEAQRPRPRDFKKCKLVLRKLHRLGYLHQDCHHGNVLYVVNKGHAILVDFKSVTKISEDNGVKQGKKSDFETLRTACGISD